MAKNNFAENLILQKSQEIRVKMSIESLENECYDDIIALSDDDNELIDFDKEDNVLDTFKTAELQEFITKLGIKNNDNPKTSPAKARKKSSTMKNKSTNNIQDTEISSTTSPTIPKNKVKLDSLKSPGNLPNNKNTNTKTIKTSSKNVTDVTLIGETSTKINTKSNNLMKNTDILPGKTDMTNKTKEKSTKEDGLVKKNKLNKKDEKESLSKKGKLTKIGGVTTQKDSLSNKDKMTKGGIVAEECLAKKGKSTKGGVVADVTLLKKGKSTKEIIPLKQSLPKKIKSTKDGLTKKDESTKGGMTSDKGTSLTQFKSRTTLLVKPGTQIFTSQMNRDDVGQPAEDLVKRMEDLAFQIAANEVSVYNTHKERTKRSQTGWMKTVVTSGTLGDKMAALTLQIQDSPLHNLASLDTLLNMAKKKGRRENSQAIETLQELFLVNILPDARPLIPLEQRPLDRLVEMSSGNKDAFDRTLLLWYTESQVKVKYVTFVKAIEVLTFDTVPESKKTAIDVVYKMLATKPEQEKLLLSILVNKMGDRDHKVASKAAYLLTKLVSYQNHPAMKPTVVKEVENLLYRPNISPRAQYYAVCFLSQILLSRGEFELANNLISIHLTFFKIYIEKGEVDRKMMSSLLAGVNRAYPYAKVDKKKISELINDLYRLVHTINFNTSIQALLLLYQVNNAQDNASDRFYTAMYKKLTDPGLRHPSKHSLMLNLLFKTMTTDTCNERVKAFIKRILQVCHHQLPPFICGAMFLISEVLKRNTNLSLNKEIRYSQQQLHSNQPEGNHDNPPVDRLRYYGDMDEDDGMEHFTDARNPDSDAESDVQADDQAENVAASWQHTLVHQQVNKKTHSEHYDPVHRNPRYSHTDRECVWELEQLALHYHPSVAMFASAILKGESISYDGDPLKDFTLIRFLDRFAFKNPKRATSDAGSAATLRRRDYKPRGLRALPLSSTAYLQTHQSRIPVEETFLYNYLKRHGPKPKSQDQDDSDNESIGDDEFDTYLETIEKKESAKDQHLDFASEMGEQKKKGKGGDDSADEESDEDVDFDDDEIKEMMGYESDDSDAVPGSDDGSDAGSDGEEEDGSDGGSDGGMEEFNEEDIAFSDDEDDEVVEKKPSAKRRLPPEGKERPGGKKPKQDMSSLFAAADEFASLLDDNQSMATDTIGTFALSNKDKADKKQLAWEAKQQRWLADSDWGRHKGDGKHKPTKYGGKSGKLKQGGKTRKQSSKPKHAARKLREN